MRFLILACVVLSVGCEGARPGVDGAVLPDEEDAATPATPLRLSWERLADDGPPVSEASMARLGDRVVLFGGLGGGGVNDYQDGTWVWQEGEWAMLPTDPTPPARRSAVFGEAGGRLILFSGIGRNAEGRVAYLEDTWAFDGTSWTELDVAAGPSPRQNVAYTSLDGVLHLHGGATGTEGRLGDGWRFDGERWTELPAGAPAQRAGSLTAVDGALLFTGGSTPGAFAGVLRLDADGWTELGRFSAGRAYHAAAAIEGHLVVFGGVRTSTTAIAETDGFPGPVELEGAEPAPSNAVLMVTLSDGALLHVGGFAPETWRVRAR